MLWGAGIGARADRVWTLRGTSVLAVAGALVLWVAPNPAVAGLGLLLGGLGSALVFPVTSSLALVFAPHAPVRASARLNLSWGFAILGAPMVLGLATGAVGITLAWGLTVALLGAAIMVILRVPRPHMQSAAAGPAEACGVLQASTG
jgi:MFS family permease